MCLLDQKRHCFRVLFDRSLTGHVVSDVLANSVKVWGAIGGSVLGTVLFTHYISGLALLLKAHGVAYHFYVDDAQFYSK